MIRVGICDDDLATREALIRILERRRGFVIAASVSSGEEAVAYRGAGRRLADGRAHDSA